MPVTNLIRLLRPHQWLKNLMLLFPPFLGGVLFQSARWVDGVIAFVAFCLASSASYIVNDIRDREADRLHPQKSTRPLACGAVSEGGATLLAALLLVSAAGLCWGQPFWFTLWLVAYLMLSLAYSFGLKDQPVFDVFCIASGFVFRLFAGGAAFDVEVSNWLFLSVLLLALFLSCGKRLAEKSLLGAASKDHRKALDSYPPGVLEGFMLVSGSAVLVTYTMYAITMHRLVFTIPLCCFGLFRYMLLVKRGASGDPTDSLLRDPLMFAVGLLWAIMVAVSTYA